MHPPPSTAPRGPLLVPITISSIVTNLLTTTCTGFFDSKKCSSNERSGESPWPPHLLFPLLFADTLHLLSPSVPPLVQEHSHGSLCFRPRRGETHPPCFLDTWLRAKGACRPPSFFPFSHFFLNCAGLCPKLSVPECQLSPLLCLTQEKKYRKLPLPSLHRDKDKLFRWILWVTLEQSNR